MNDIRTALDIKEAIEGVEDLSSQGTSDSIRKVFYQNILGYDGYDEDDEDDEKKEKEPFNLPRILELSETKPYAKTSKYQYEGFIDGNLSIHCPGFDFTGTIQNFSHEQGFELFEQAPQAPFGDIQSMTTVIDENVRKARNITSEHFEVGPEVCSEVERIWTQKMGRFQGLRAVPYKINLYSNGGKFKSHRDTPETGLIGTFLISLGDNSYDFCGQGGLLIQDKAHWNSRGNGSWCCFYPDCIHEVLEVKGYTRNFHGDEKCDNPWCKEDHIEKEDLAIRMTLAFKIYAQQNIDPDRRIQDNIREISELLKEVPRDRFGLVLAHSYNLTADVLKGRDSKIWSALQLLGWKVHIIPIVVSLSVGTDYEGDINQDEINCSIYPFTESHIDYLKGLIFEDDLDPEIEELCTDLEYYNLGEIGITWNRNSIPYCAYTGNEAQAGEEDGIYLNKAFIISKVVS